MAGQPVIIDSTMKPGTESHDNPFQADGDLAKKAETIIKASTISRTELKIVDPDTSAEDVEELMVANTANQSHAAPPTANDQRPNEIKVKANGNVDEPLTPQSVEVEVGKANATAAEPQTAEQVNLKSDKKCKCCVVM